MKTLLIPAIFFILASGTASHGVQFQSGSRQTHLLELYSSEGCSSCPPADRWFAALRYQSGLWKTFVPVEFHVDYWNRLGWTDRFSKSAFTARQQEFSREWRTSSVYTPGFALNGLEWRQGRGDSSFTEQATHEVGRLEVTEISKNRFYAKFKPSKAGSNFNLHGALLGNGLVSRVSSGENSGRSLRHDFVVLQMTQQAMKAHSDGTQEAQIELESPGTVKPGSYSVAFWVSLPGSQKPIQAVGGDLK